MTDFRTEEDVLTPDAVQGIDANIDAEAVIPAEPPAESPGNGWKMLAMSLLLPPRGAPELRLTLALDADAGAPIVDEAAAMEAELRKQVGELAGASEENAVYQATVGREAELRTERGRLAASLAEVEREVDGASMERLVELTALEADCRAMTATIDRATVATQRQRLAAERELRRRAVVIADEQRTKMMGFVEKTESNAAGLFLQAAPELAELIKLQVLRGAFAGHSWAEIVAKHAADQLMVQTPPPPAPSCPQNWAAAVRPPDERRSSIRRSVSRTGKVAGYPGRSVIIRSNTKEN